MPSLNIGYILYQVVELIMGVHVSGTAVSGSFMFFIETLATMGMVVAIVLLVCVLYVRIRLIQVEHHGFLEKEEEERLHRMEHAEAEKNPRWELISSLAGSSNESDWRRAIIEADIMLQALLVERGIPGETLGDQLKNANPLQFTTLDIAWEAHRMRNAIAHLGEAFPLSERDMRATIDQYRRVFEEFDYI